jgi:leader peptidase (prepilin peptidase)/N-methyltransferase
VQVPDWIWFVFVFAFGCCVGSFLNVVIYRLPRDKSLVKPGSACPACGRHIRFYDNIPLLSWLFLAAKCRYCKSPISPRYFIIELLTSLVFTGLFFLYFYTDFREGIPPFLGGGGIVYLLHIIMLGAFITASAIDMELWIIPLAICWFVTAVGLIGSSVGAFIIDPVLISGYNLLPNASAGTGALAAGAVVGLAISLFALATGLIKRSYESDDSDSEGSKPEKQNNELAEPHFNHRLEAFREVVFLLPIIICAVIVFFLVRKIPTIRTWWMEFSQRPVITGVLGSVWGYFVGCGIVWITRILGTLGFGKEAMGLGDVHLMGAAGAIIGSEQVAVAFFIAPFYGLAWAVFQMFFKKIRQIPYGPFLSLGIFTVMIFHDWIFRYLSIIFYR